MKNLYLLLITVVFLQISGCKKDSNRITTPAYQLDYILVETPYPPGTYIDSTFIRTDSLYLDSIWNLNINPSLSMYEEFITQEDSLLYNTTPDIYGFSSHANAAFFQNKLIYTSFYSGNQNYVRSGDVSYSYSSNRLSSFNMSTYISHDAIIDLGQDIHSVLNYTGNDLSSLSSFGYYRTGNVYVDNEYYPIDTTVQKNSSVTFSYLTNENQKQLIGLDLNDLIFNTFLQAYSYSTISYGGLINYPFLEKILLLNGIISYNTNCEHLISNIEIQSPCSLGRELTLQPSNITINYAFDKNHHNRIHSLDIEQVEMCSLPAVGATKYTFYYKD